jgi:hypothetical protein
MQNCAQQGRKVFKSPSAAVKRHFRFQPTPSLAPSTS